MSEKSPGLPSEADLLFGDYLGKIEHCVGLLSHDQLWWRPNPRCNSVANLLLHLCGNLSQWVLAGLGGASYQRHRREEFAAVRGDDAPALVRRLHDVVSRCRGVARGLPEEKLRHAYLIQGMRRSGFGVLLHAVEHMAYHTGQIVYITKQLVRDGLEIEFYPHLR